MAKNVSSTLHSIDFNIDSSQIIGHEKILKQRLLQKMISIEKNLTSLNKKTDIENLNTSYLNLLIRSKIRHYTERLTLLFCRSKSI